MLKRLAASLASALCVLAVAAARKIKFRPAQADGRAVSQWVTLEYDFTDGEGGGARP